MCGIAGIISPNMDQAALAATTTTLLSAIVHRGPDDGGHWTGPDLAFGTRRLSIIDLAGGHQPMISADGRVVLSFNGEIYNFRELRAELSHRGHLFRTRSDSEVILNGYLEWGAEVVNHLNGMFALAIYDSAQRRLVLARDHFGVKPLYYCHGLHPESGPFFAFCSEPAPLLALPGVERRLDSEGLFNFLSYKYSPGPSTLVAAMQKLPPASLLTIDPATLTHSVTGFWQLRPHPTDSSPAQAEEQLRALLIQALRRQLVSDVPVGLFLSGGIDSGLLLWAARASGETTLERAYTIGFADPSFDESALARLTANHLQIGHHLEQLPNLVPSDLDAMITAFGEPFANTSVPANFLVSRIAARHVKVVLNGSGADELFGGYDRYYAVRPPWPMQFAAALRPALAPLVDHLPSGRHKRSLVQRAKVFLRGCELSLAERHANSIRLFDHQELTQLAPGLATGHTDPITCRFLAAPSTDPLQQATWTDLTTMMPDDYLTLVDRTSMAASLEVRVPFLDLDLANFGFALETNQKINGWEKKRILRRLAAEHLPKAIARQPKQGFESTVGEWFRTGLGKHLLELLDNSPMAPLLNRAVVEQILTHHRTGQRDASKQLLGLYTLCQWSRQNGLTAP